MTALLLLPALFVIALIVSALVLLCGTIRGMIDRGEW